jgi:nitroimidazol reductase NimA-like FMN-containing flavoprotein (pyridoxamine 5'-phosphate oxidase superfamily)
MFRTMRRSVQALSHDEMIDLLKTETRGVMSVQGDDGYPYGFPINHYYDEEANKIYIHGANFGHRVDAVKRDPKVSYCVFGQDYQKEGDWAKYVKSVIVFGKAELIANGNLMRRADLTGVLGVVLKIFLVQYTVFITYEAEKETTDS